MSFLTFFVGNILTVGDDLAKSQVHGVYKFLCGKNKKFFVLYKQSLACGRSIAFLSLIKLAMCKNVRQQEKLQVNLVSLQCQPNVHRVKLIMELALFAIEW